MQARGACVIEDIKQLVKHRAIYPALLMTLLFQFAPGLNTPRQYYLTNELHASDIVAETSAEIAMAAHG